MHLTLDVIHDRADKSLFRCMIQYQLFSYIYSSILDQDLEFASCVSCVWTLQAAHGAWKHFLACVCVSRVSRDLIQNFIMGRAMIQETQTLAMKTALCKYLWLITMTQRREYLKLPEYGWIPWYPQTSLVECSP